MNYHLQGMITRLELDLSQASELVAQEESRVRAANKKQYDIKKALSECKQQAVTEERIEELGIRARTVELATQTLARCKQTKYLQHGNMCIESAYYRLVSFLDHGCYPKFGRSGGALRNELFVLGWCTDILSYDSADKSVPLSADVDFEMSRIHDEIQNKKDQTQ